MVHKDRWKNSQGSDRVSRAHGLDPVCHTKACPPADWMPKQNKNIQTPQKRKGVTTFKFLAKYLC